MAHRVRTHHWRLGRLEVKDSFFESELEALAFATSVDDASSVKIFDHNDQLTHDVIATVGNTYA